MNLDYLAYCILVLAAIFILLPVIGNSINDRSGYLESLKIGGALFLFVSSVGILIAAIMWSIHHVLLG